MSHIPASKMPHAKPHHDEDESKPADSAGTILPGSAADEGNDPATTASASPTGSANKMSDQPRKQTRDNGPTFSTSGDFPLAAVAVGGLLVVGAIAAAVLPFLGDDDRKGKKKKKAGKRKSPKSSAT